MVLKVYKIFLFLVVINTVSVKAQRNDDPEKQQAEYEKKVKEEMTERIQLFVDVLMVDDFQKEIIKQKMHSFYDARKAIYMDISLKYFERDEQLKTLEYAHFSDIKEMITEDTMSQIQSFIKDAGTSLKNEKKKNKKKKNKD